MQNTRLHKIFEPDQLVKENDYLISLARWQITSTEKLKASAKAMPCQKDCSLKNAMIIMTKQKMLTITVKAFFSVKYCFILEFVKDGFHTRCKETKISWCHFIICYSSAKAEKTSAKSVQSLHRCAFTTNRTRPLAALCKRKNRKLHPSFWRLQRNLPVP
ncbi:MAG TPA: hypothetical protein VFL47_17345 [Flavisolibacter sp.]|nr:hypothetical protein [Flavisolibacter sp.]